MTPLLIHPACNSTPRRTDVEINRLRDGLLNDGQIDPIITWRGQVIDGRHRQSILIAEGREPKYEARDDMSEADVLTFIWSRLDFRKITDGQRAVWWEANHPKAEHGGDRGNQHTGGKFAKDKVATQLPRGITKTMIDNISSLRRNDLELYEAVAAGKLSPSKAYKKYRATNDAAPNARQKGYVQHAIDAGLMSAQPSGTTRRALREQIAEVAGVPADQIPKANRNPELAARVHSAIDSLAAKKQGKTPEQQYEDHRREVAALPESAKAKFERLVATEKRLLNEIFRSEVAAEALKTAPGLREEMERQRDHYIRENAHLARIKSGITPLISEAEYRMLLGVLHPDRAPEDRREKFARAFDIVRKLDEYIKATK